MSFNAVLRKANAEVFGSVLLTTLRTLPEEWEVTLGGKFISKDTDFKTLLCDSELPLSVHTVPVEREIIFKLKSKDEKENFAYSFSFPKHLTVRQLKSRIRYWVEKDDKRSSSLQMVDVYLYKDADNTALLDGSKTIEEVVLRRKSTLYGKLVGRYRQGNRNRAGTGCLNSMTREWKEDRLSSVCSKKKVPIDWEGYSKGLTVYGTCTRKSCKSNKTVLQTTHQAGYGFLDIHLNKTIVPCGACTGKFPPAKVIVCDARALFRYKRSDKPLEIKTKVVESFGGINKFADDGPEVAEYDCIEVTTVKKDESFHVCGRCDMPIRKKVDEVLYDCGHPFHLACKEDKCGICNTRCLSEGEFNTWVDNGAEADAWMEPEPSDILPEKKRRKQSVL